MGNPILDTLTYAAQVNVKLNTIRVPVLDVNGNVASFNSTGNIVVTVTSDVPLTGSTTITLMAAGNLVFDSVTMIQPLGGIHTLTFTPTAASGINLAPTSFNITIAAGPAYALQLAQTVNSIQCQYLDLPTFFNVVLCCVVLCCVVLCCVVLCCVVLCCVVLCCVVLCCVVLCCFVSFQFFFFFDYERPVSNFPVLNVVLYDSGNTNVFGI